MTLRQEGPQYKLTNRGGSWNGGGVYYQNLPTYLRDKMPMYGTQDVNTGDANTLYLPTKTMVYMFRQDNWSAVNMTGWTYGSTGPYLAGYSTVEMYTKTIESGTYTIENLSAMYLFDPDY